MKQYVAFDVSKQTSEAVIVDETGKCLVRRKLRTDPTVMAGFVRRHGENVALVGLEAGPLSTWLFHELRAAGLPVVCMDSWRARAALSARLNKTDRTDALGLADLLRVGFHHSVHVKSYASHERRTLLKAREALVAERRTLQNKVRGLLETFGLVLGKGSGGRFAVLVEEALEQRPTLRVAIAPLMRLWQAAREAAAELHRHLRRLAQADPDCRRLMTTDGVGPITAVAFKAALDDPHRFHDSRAVGAYFGLTPRRHQSGQRDHTGHISRSGEGFVRALLFEAALCLYFRSKRATPLRAWAEALAARVGTKKAIVALARKLAVILHAMLVHGRDFDTDRQAVAAA